jgi:hypothetical protein
LHAPALGPVENANRHVADINIAGAGEHYRTPECGHKILILGSCEQPIEAQPAHERTFGTLAEHFGEAAPTIAARRSVRPNVGENRCCRGNAWEPTIDLASAETELVVEIENRGLSNRVNRGGRVP